MSSYADAGVDIAAGERAVALMAAAVRRTARPEVRGGLGGFAGLFELDLARWRRPVLATSTDGVGTKVAIATALDRHDTIGIDLVAMVVDDIVVCGAEPLFLTDYIACGRLVPERIAAIVGGVAEGCRSAGCALVGGETAEHPGLMEPDAYDLAGAGVGVVEADSLLGPERVAPGDVVVAMGSSGVHANGFSLVRRALLERAGMALDAPVRELGGAPLGDVLLTPTRIYAADCLALLRELPGAVHALAHVTGGGIAANLARVLPAGVQAVLDRSTWTPPAVFDLVARRGGVPAAEMEATFNQGVGMLAVVAAADAPRVVELLRERGVSAWAAGAVERMEEPGAGRALLRGEHPAPSGVSG